MAICVMKVNSSYLLLGIRYRKQSIHSEVFETLKHAHNRRISATNFKSELFYKRKNIKEKWTLVLVLCCSVRK